jgi:hypothetical protein
VAADYSSRPSARRHYRGRRQASWTVRRLRVFFAACGAVTVSDWHLVTLICNGSWPSGALYPRLPENPPGGLMDVRIYDNIWPSG